jgi:hypothetical protein
MYSDDNGEKEIHFKQQKVAIWVVTIIVGHEFYKEVLRVDFVLIDHLVLQREKSTRSVPNIPMPSIA